MGHALTSTTEKRCITVLAVGNPILHDDGTGQAILASLQNQPQDCWQPKSQDHRSPGSMSAPSQHPHYPDVHFIDGGISGMELLPIIQDASHLLILDAIAGSQPGTVVSLEGDQIPRLRRAKLSPHQVGLLDLLSAARLIGGEPQQVAAVGIVPDRLDPGVGLSNPVRSALPDATDEARRILQGWLSATPHQYV
ncbi:hydrogenase maturation protease [Corynebacterium sp. 3HC-13]|uniref:HyaD/HybD family hydrogenase maturation endopeptidase n=1 Tax=Corynebacterium poyangense TaxID=2684405 RepID=UPI001CC9AA50|nr:HyaD/HybD family hydrogenase maturation endopeptidase [Corynebacterium poyangense]MBZ8176461.1 hydrogenase maturation protease [Corynebacterium poyangense]